MYHVCSEARIPGYITNHSLCVTDATWLFQKGVDKQLIVVQTGHRSTDVIRAYKRISGEQQKALSEVLNNPQKEEPKEYKYPSAAKKLRETPAIDCVETATESTGKVNSFPMNFSGCTGTIAINFGAHWLLSHWLGSDHNWNSFLFLYLLYLISESLIRNIWVTNWTTLHLAEIFFFLLRL